MNHETIGWYTTPVYVYDPIADADWALALCAEIRALPETVECPEADLEQFH